MLSVSIRGVTNQTRVRVDTEEEALRVIQSLDSNINDGTIYDSSHHFPGVAKGTTAGMAFRGSGVTSHVLFFINSNATQAAFALHENTALTGAGTTKVVNNRNRGGVSILTGVSVFHTPVVSSYSGVTLLEGVVNGASMTQPYSWVFPGGVTYTLSVRNRKGAAQDFSLRLMWHEVR